MKNKVLSAGTLRFLGIITAISFIVIVSFMVILQVKAPEQTQAVSVRSTNAQIQADGAVTSQNQATLHFQTGGQLVYLPFKEGDEIKQGQILARLDTATLQRQLTQALNNFRSTRNTFDQTQQNSRTGVLQGQQKYTLDVTNKSGISGQAETDAINDMVMRIIDQNQANLDNSVLNVEIAQQAIQLASIASPISGVVTHMDVTTPYVNVTPLTSFTVADPADLVFRANISESDIDFVREGSNVTIKLGGGFGKTLSGTVSKIYPDKVTLPTGQKAYQVDVSSPELIGDAKMGEGGTALIQSSDQSSAKLVPTWTILNHDSLWIVSSGKPVLRTVVVGKNHGDMTEIISGLEEGDEVITNPVSVISKKYSIL